MIGYNIILHNMVSYHNMILIAYCGILATPAVGIQCSYCAHCLCVGQTNNDYYGVHIMSALLDSWPLELTLLYEPRRVQLDPRYIHSDYDGVHIGRTHELIPSQ